MAALPQRSTNTERNSTTERGAIAVRLEVRHGPARPVTYDVTGDEFVIGGVPGCDLRLPGTNLPPVVCIINRQADGVRIRKLAPTLPVLLNGQAISSTGPTALQQGDCLSIGAIDLYVIIPLGQSSAVKHAPRPEPLPAQPTISPREIEELHRKFQELEKSTQQARVEEENRRQEWVRRQNELDERQRVLEESTRELEADRVLWYERRDEMEKELRQSRQEITEARKERDELRRNIGVADPEVRLRLEREIAADYRERNEEIERLQLSLREAAVQLREKKQQFDEERKLAEPRLQEIAEQRRSLDAAVAELQRQRELFEADRRIVNDRVQKREQDLIAREKNCRQREDRLVQDRTEAEKGFALYQSDIVRLDRLQASLEEKEKRLQQRAMEIDHRFEQFQRDTRDLEEHVRILDERQEQIRAEEDRQSKQREELDKRQTKLNERTALLEGQQITLTALRSRMEHMREELRQESSRLAEERAKLETDSRDTQERLKQAERLKDEVSSERANQNEGMRLYKERSELMEKAVRRLRELQTQLTEEDTRVSKLREELELRGAEQAEEAGLIKARAEQLLEATRRLEADRQALRERELAVHEGEQARETLQEQLRRRSEELAIRHREMDEQSRQHEEQVKQMAEETTRLEALRVEVLTAKQSTDELKAELAQRDATLKQQAERLQTTEKLLADQRLELEEAQARWNETHRQAELEIQKARAEIDELRTALDQQTKQLLGQMPDLEQRAQAALDRTSQAKEGLRGQLAELHSYARQSQEELEGVRVQVQREIDRLRSQEGALNRSRSEHRLAVASFRQQLVEWQSRFAEMKQALHHGETRLDIRHKANQETSQQLAVQAQELQQKEREVRERHTEVERHLTDMREWYRKKLREIVQSKNRERGTSLRDDGPILSLPETPMATTPPESSAAQPPIILTMQEDLDPIDRKLGERLLALELVDGDTLMALWNESRRQRKALRQVLLSGGYLTLYQLALIESENLSGLVLGRFRVVDRLVSTPRESLYRVFDPQSATEAHQGTCLLRQLGEAEMQDAVRPDEYRQRFGAARDIAHPNLASTYEVLEINGRPAVLQEWVRGLPSGDFPALVATPGVWYRLLAQAALGLHTAHQSGVYHGRLSPEMFVLNRQGILKISGFGEPPWLTASGNPLAEGTPEGDIRALGQIVASWSLATGKRKGARPKSFPSGLLEVLQGLGINEDGSLLPTALYPNAAALLEDLDRIGSEVSSDAMAWEKLLTFVGENSTEGPLLRRSA